MSALDVLVLLAFAAATLAVGIRAGGGRADGEDLILARRQLPAWAVLGSTVATELSAATFIGVPHAAYVGDWSYLQLALGALAGKALLAWRVIPLYYRLRVVTVYGFLEERYGARTRRLAALCFVGGRVLASGARLFIAALALSVATAVSIEAAIVVAGAIAGAYTVWGGIRAVVWTDALQALVFLVAAGAIVLVLVSQAPGGIEALWDWAQQGERTRVLHLDPVFSWRDVTPFGVGVLGGFFLTLATHGTDYDMVQRLLATRSGRGAARALFGSALLNFPLTALFLFIGTGLAFAYASPPPYGLPEASQVLPTFALHELPSGLRGLLFAGLAAAALSSLDSAVCAIGTTWIVDVRPGPEVARGVRLRRASVVVCLVLIGAALAMAAYHAALVADSERIGAVPLSLVELALAAMTILYGGLLGVFGLGLATGRRGNDGSGLGGLALGGAVGLALFLHPLLLGETVIAWPWWIPLAAAAAAGVAATGRSRAAPCAAGDSRAR